MRNSLDLSVLSSSLKTTPELADDVWVWGRAKADYEERKTHLLKNLSSGPVASPARRRQ
jgi:hypothetical protein